MKKNVKKALSFFLAVLIICTAGATAAAAEKGDVDGDGNCTASDARLILRFSVGLESFTTAEKQTADMDNDGSVSSSDARLALRKSVGLYTDPVDPTVSVAENEYEILVSGTFAFSGVVTDSSGSANTTLAITDNSTYMTSDFNGTDIGVLVLDGKVYMINPEEKAYLYVDPLTMATLQLSADDLKLETAFSPLSDAMSYPDETVNGVTCKVYAFELSNGTVSKIYLNGEKLVMMSQTNSNGELVTKTEFSSITADVPADMSGIPGGYKRVSLIKFMGYLL